LWSVRRSACARGCLWRGPKTLATAWRVTCPACGAPLSDTDERPDTRETLRDTSPFGCLSPEALAGEPIIERFLCGDGSFELSPIALMRALLVQTWLPFAVAAPPGLGARHALSGARLFFPRGSMCTNLVARQLFETSRSTAKAPGRVDGLLLVDDSEGASMGRPL
jgi:hypothetical protein